MACWRVWQTFTEVPKGASLDRLLRSVVVSIRGGLYTMTRKACEMSDPFWLVMLALMTGWLLAGGDVALSRGSSVIPFEA